MYPYTPAVTVGQRVHPRLSLSSSFRLAITTRHPLLRSSGCASCYHHLCGGRLLLLSLLLLPPLSLARVSWKKDARNKSVNQSVSHSRDQQALALSLLTRRPWDF